MALQTPETKWLTDTFLFGSFSKEVLLSQRFLVWLCFQLESNGILIKLNEYPSFNIYTRIRGHLHDNKNLIDTIKLAMSKQLLSINHFNWVTDNRRQNAWISDELLMSIHNQHVFPPFIQDKLTQLGRPYSITPLLTGRELTIFLFDIHEAHDLTAQVNFLSNVRASWDRFTSDTDALFNWFSCDTSEEATSRCHHLRDWLMAQKNFSYPFVPAFESQEDVLIFIDRWKRFAANGDTLVRRMENVGAINAQVTLLIRNYKARWAQKKSRSKDKERKQRNFIISNNAIQKLDALARQYSLSKSDVLELLIKMENKNKIYLNEFDIQRKIDRQLIDKIGKI